MPAAEDLDGRFEAAGLYDPASADAPDRLELLEHLIGRGLSIEQITAAASAGDLPTAAADLAMFGFGPERSVDQIAAACGVNADRVVRVRLAGGLPVVEGAPIPGWVAEDVAGFVLGAALFGEAPTLAFTRVVGSTAGRVAEAAVALFLTEVNSQLAEAGAKPIEFALANEEAASLVDVVVRLMSHLLREHLGLAVQRQRAGAAGLAGPETVVAIGFVDLAGSTEWAEALPLRAQADALARFESLAWDLAAAEGARIVKLIGDEVMFAAQDPAAACRLAVGLCRAVDDEPSLPRARGAIGYGLVAARDGDYYGSMIHLVNRAVKAAAEGQVVVTPDVIARCEEAGAPIAATPLGALQLRGIERPVELFALTGA